MQERHISGSLASFIVEGPDTLYWLLLLLGAIFADLVVGQFLTGKLPSLDKFIGDFAESVSYKMDRQGRSDTALKIRGLLTLVLLLPLFFMVGYLLNHLSRGSSAVSAFTLVLLIPFVAQKKMWLAHTKSGRRIATDTSMNDPHALAQMSTQSIILQFSTRYVAAAILFAFAGFAALLPFRFLNGLIQTGTKRSTELSPYFYYVKWLHELIAIPISIISTFILALSHFFIPGTNLKFLGSLEPNKTRTIASCFLPLNMVATGTNLSFKRHDGSGAQKQGQSRWIGPEFGRAKITPKDMRTVWFVILVAFALSLILLLMYLLMVSASYSNEL